MVRKMAQRRGINMAETQVATQAERGLKPRPECLKAAR